MGYNESLTRTWDRSTPNDGLLFAAEFQRLYDNFIAIVNNGGSAPTKDMEALNTFMVNLQKGQTKFNGLELSNAADADHDITIASGWVVDSTGIYNLNLPSPLTKQIDATWVAGDNAGGLFSGAALTADTFYYVFLIRKDSDGSIDAGFDDNKLATNIPAGYTAFRRLRGVPFTDSSSNILGFYQDGDYFWYNSAIQDVSSTNGVTTTRALFTVSVPPDFVGLMVIHGDDGSARHALIGCPNEDDVAPSVSLFDLRIVSSGTQQGLYKPILVNSSSQIYARVDAVSLDKFYVNTRGYFDSGK